MKKKHIIFLSLTLIATIAFTISSCAKKNAAPVIDIQEPLNNEMVTLPDSVHVEGTITDDESLHEASIVIIKSTGDTAFQDYPYVHDLKKYDFHYHFHPSTAGTYTLHVTAADHKELKTEKTLTIMVM